MTSTHPSTPLVPPIYQSSVYAVPDLDTVDAIYEGREPGYIYARDDHPNANHLAGELNKLESADWAVMCGSGMSAMSAALVGLLKQGDRIVASNRLYGRTVQLLNEHLARFGIEIDTVDLHDLDAAREALEKPAWIVIVESLSNPLLRLANIPALAELCNARGCLLLVDNTFTPPPILRPIELGADLVVESLTKMISGHGDVTLGAVCGRIGLEDPIRQTMRIWGLMSNPFECWLATRGLSTLSLRVEAACKNALALADWLQDQPHIGRVIYPGREDHPDFDLAQHHLGERFGHMLCFELMGGRDAVNHFMRKASGIPFSPSLGHTHTTCSHPESTSHRFFRPAEREALGITPGMLRLSIGIEPLDEIKEKLFNGLH